MKLMNALGIAAATLIAAPVVAQTSTAPAAAAPAAGANVTAGAKVFDAQGGEVGTVESVTNGVAVVDTGTNKVGLPIASFGAGANGPAIAMTKAELDAAASQASQQSAAELKAQLTTGATVYGAGGAQVGTIKEADDQYITLARPKGSVKLPVSAFGKGTSGPMISMTAEELDKAMAAAAPAPAK
jgi:preprotein translocase subunit YajC